MDFFQNLYCFKFYFFLYNLWPHYCNLSLEMQAPQAASIDTTDGTNLVTNNRIQVLIPYLASLTTLVEKVEVVMPK